MYILCCATKTTYLDQWIIKLFSILEAGLTFYKFSVFWQEETNNQCCSQQAYSTEEAAYLAAFFFCLRASLDREKCPALIMDFKAGYILSINLPAFHLFGVNAVGFKMLDFAVNLENYERIYRELQQTGKSHQSILLHNADGHLVECEVDAQIEPYWSGWAIFRLRANKLTHHTQTSR